MIQRVGNNNMKYFIASVLLAVTASGAGCKASGPGRIETTAAREAKQMAIGGKDLKNPTPDNEATVKAGAEHFQHHCSVCHGLDGQNTGVPFAQKTSPPVADLKSTEVQKYTDGQLKWIIENGIRFTGMPAWTGVLDDGEMWAIVRYLRHLPEKGSLGVPAIYKEEAEEHEAAHKHADSASRDQAGHHHEKTK